MTEKITAKLDIRTTTGKKVAELRDSGLVPGVIYGKELEATNIQLPQQEAARLVKQAGTHSTIDLDVAGKNATALIKSVEYAPATSRITHISFQAVSADEVITTEIPVILDSPETSPAVKAGLVVVPAIEQVEVRAKASDLPDKIVVPTDSLVKAGDKLLISAAKLPAGVEFVSLEEDAAVATVRDEASIEAANEADETSAADAANVPADNGSEAKAE